MCTVAVHCLFSTHASGQGARYILHRCAQTLEALPNECGLRMNKFDIAPGYLNAVIAAVDGVYPDSGLDVVQLPTADDCEHDVRSTGARRRSADAVLEGICTRSGELAIGQRVPSKSETTNNVSA